MAALPAYSEDSTKCQVPSLIDATSDELLSGLEQERFTSLDLVNVSSFPPPPPPTPPRLLIYSQKQFDTHLMVNYEKEKRKKVGLLWQNE